ncbi:hypothetical protein CDD83_255 [Cordyceps sp. RAO-2017]|nr:hypothetical protein CDD83_255 [Cordyceps sp. RAO-2017]
MDEPTNHGMVKELHEDLARKYKTIGPRVETIWRSFDKGKRTRCLKAGAEDGVVLRHPLDPALGNVCKFMPEWNLRDIAEPGSDFLLHLLRHRATKSLYEQYCEGANGAPGDRDLIIDMMLTRNLRHVDSFKDCFTIFLDNDQYGMSSRMVSHHAETLAKLQPAIQAGVCVPQSTGELILMRQLYLLQSLNILVEDILDQGSQTRDRKDRPKKPDDAATAALSKLAIDTPSAQPTLPDLMASARDQRDSLEDYLTLLCSEPVVLAHAVNMSFFGRPELVADEKGRRLPVHTDKYTSAAFFDVIHGAIKAAAIWKYIAHLLELLESSASDKVYRAIVLQEISNICHLEYSRAQAIFRQYVQTCTGAKWFRRASNGLDSVGNPRVTMKGDPEELTRADPQLHYMLRLCQTDTNASKAVGWLTKLSELHAAHPAEREKLLPAEADSLSDLAVIVAFIQDLSPAVSMPSFSRKKRQAFVARSQGLEAELNQLKKQVDLRDFAAPS